MVEAMEIQKEYKKTEVGLIPNDWNLLALGELGIFKNGINKSKEAFGHGSPFVNLLDVFGKNSIDRSTQLDLINSNEAEKQLYSLKEGDVIIVRSSVKPSGVGLTILVKEDLPDTVFSGFLIRFRDNGKIGKDYKIHCFYEEGFRRRLVSSSTVSANTNINQEALKNLLVPLPPTKAEQTAIATTLNDADVLISHLEKLIAKKRAIKQGAMQELLKPKEAWEVKKLGEIANINMGQSPNSKYYQSYRVGLPLIQGNTDLENRRQLIRFWTSQITKTCNAGDIIMTVRAPVGVIGIAHELSCIGRGVCSLKVTNVDKYFLYHLLIFKETDWKILEQGSTFTSANSNQIFGFELSIPREEIEQAHIAKILSDMDVEIEALEKKLEKYKMVKQGMMQNLLMGKIRLI